MKLNLDLDFENILDSDSDDVVIAEAARLIGDTIEEINYYTTEFLIERDYKVRSIVNFCNTGEFL